MNFIPYDNSIEPWVNAVGITAAVLILLGMVVFARRPKDSDGNSKEAKIAVGFLTAGMLGFVVVVFAAITMMSNSSAQRTEAELDQIRDSYGIELTSQELYSLDYPFEKPQDDFEVFGHIDKRVQTEGTSFSEKRIYLVWADGKLGLSESSNGKDYTALKSKN